MEHPIFFIDAILSAIGLEHFAHHYSHVTHAWLIMLLLIGSAILFGKGVQLLPKKGQNVFEVIIGGLEDFTVDITGPDLERLIQLGGRIFGQTMQLLPGSQVP